MTVIDLFCGCGGLSLGAYEAGLCTSLAVDIDPNLLSAYSINFPTSRVVNADIALLEPEDAKSRWGLSRPTAILGGPPCQGFSIIGRRQVDDPRNGLLRRYFEYVAYFEPSFFVMENVPGLAYDNNRTVLDSALELVPGKYRILNPLVLDAADYGAATSRPRLVVIGYDPSELDHFEISNVEAMMVEERSDVSAAIRDLPEPQAAGNGDGWLRYRNDVEPSDYASTMRRLPRQGLGSNEAVNKLGKGLVNGYQLTRHNEEVTRRFDSLKPGERDKISKYPRLSWDRPAYVLRAGTGKERGSYQAARPVHPDQPRVITVREAARIQGFPDWFQFHPTKWHSHRMIGNSVSPLFAKAVLGALMSKLGAEQIIQAAE